MRLEFTGIVPGWWIAALALLGGVLIASWYWRETRWLQRPWSFILPLLRAIAFALMLGMLAGPTIRYQHIDGTLGRIAWVLDRSRSMAIQDPDREQSRIEQLRAALQSSGNGNPSNGGLGTGVLARVAESHHLRLFTTEGEKLWDSLQDREPVPTKAWNAVEDSTPLGDVLLSLLSSSEQTQDTSQPDPPAAWDAIVVLTDGQSNSGAAVDDVVRSSGRRVPIYSLGVGDRTEPVDIAVLEATFSSSVRSEDRLRGSLRVKETLPAGTPYRVGVEHEGDVVWSQEVISQNRGVYEVTLDVPAAPLLARAQQLHPSRFEQRAVPLDLMGWVETEAVELTRENNRLASSAWGVVKQNSVLLLDPLGGWESRYLRNALDRDPAWKVNAFLGPNAFRAEFFPRTKQDLFELDLLIMTMESAGSIPAEKQTWLRDYVAYAGAGLIVLDSVKGSETTPPAWLQELLPVQRTDTSAQQSVQNLDLASSPPANVLGDTRGAIQTLKLTSVGSQQPAFQFESDGIANQKLWSQLQPPHTYRHREPKGGAEVILEGVVDRNRSIPLIATQRFGQGRVVYLATDETWRWRYGVSDLYHQRFWNQLAGWIMRPPFIVRGERIAIDAGTRVVRHGESLQIRAKILGDDGTPIGLDRVLATVDANGQTIAVVELQAVENAEGFFEGEWTIPTAGVVPVDESLVPIEGEYRIQLVPDGLPEETKLLATSVYVMRPPDREWERLARNESLLQRMAVESGGQYLDIQQSEELVERLKAYSNGKVLGVTIPLWQSFPWFFAILILLASEWWLRKRVGLV
ncbi:hypothetical protein SH467x_002489 [Pirellulaceae bacterium SH467]